MMSLLTPSNGCPCCVGRMPLEAPAPMNLQLEQARAAAAARPRFDMPQSGPLLLAGGTVVDPRTGAVAQADVYVDKGRIVAVEPTGSTKTFPGAQRIDATSKWIVPGYNDMHTHVMELKDPSGSFALMLADGVTGVRQMSGSPELVAQRRASTLPLQKEGPALLELPGALLTPMNATSPETVTAEIEAQKAYGADFIKAGVMGAATFKAALVAAKKNGITILGHLQDGLGAAEASDLGFKSIEHIGPGATVWIGCSTEETSLQAQAAVLPRMLRKSPPKFLHPLIKWRLQTLLINPAAFMAPDFVARLQRAMDTYDEGKADALAKKFVANKTWHCPTLVRLRTQYLNDAPEYQTHPDLRYMPKKAISKWQGVTKRFSKLPAQMRQTYKEAYPRQLTLAKKLLDAGVKMLAGSDGGWLSNPGLTLPEEFVELAKAGFSPLQVLQATTSNAAEYLGRGSSMGTVEAGKNADLVVLDADPLASVDNLSKIAGVVRAGFHYSRKDLDALRERVAQTRGTLR